MKNIVRGCLSRLRRYEPDSRDLQSLITLVGVASGLAGLAQFIWPTLPSSITPRVAVASLVLGGVLLALLRLRRSKLVAKFPSGEWIVSIEAGDLFDHRNAVITVDRGWSAALETVGSDSLVGQLTARLGAAERGALQDRLRHLSSEGPADSGSCAELSLTYANAVHTVVLLTVGTPTESGTETAWQRLWQAHDGLWRFVRKRNMSDLAAPVVGAGFSNSRLSHSAVLMTFLLSFHSAALDRPVCPRLVITVPTELLTRAELRQVAGLLDALGYEVNWA